MDKDLVELKEKWEKEKRERWTIVYPVILIVLVLTFEVILLK